MPRIKVTNEIASQIDGMKDRGMSVSEIARSLDLDRRTVKAAIERLKIAKGRQHWDEVSKHVDAQFLIRHYSQIKKLAIAILDQVAIEDFLSIHPSVMCESIIGMSFINTFGYDEDIDQKEELGSAGFEEPLHNVSVNRSRTLGTRLMEAMRSHEPGLVEHIDGWCKAFNRIQRERQILVHEANNAFDEYGLESSRVKRAIEWVTREAWELHLNGLSAGCFKFNEVGEALVGVFRQLEEIISENIFVGNPQEIREFQGIYESVLKSIRRSASLDRIDEAYHKLLAERQKAEECIDIMLLRGRPQGTCIYCPFHEK